MPHKPVELNIAKISTNKCRNGQKIYVVTNLIEKAKGLEVFEIPLIGFNAGSHVWEPICCAYDLACEMKRVLKADLDCPIILNEDGNVMDGWHRVAKALLEGRETIKAVRFKEMPPCDYMETE